jgi:ABC-type polysaccharide/polyol phosphate export permease
LASTAVPGPVYDSARRSGFLLGLTSAWSHRELVVLLAQRELDARYGVTLLGSFWSLVTPLAYAGVLSAVFSRVHAFRSSEVPFVVFVLSGVIVLNFVAVTALAVAQSVVLNRVALRRVFVPVSVFAASTTLTSLVLLTLSSVALVVVEVLAGVTIPWTVVLLPIAFVLLAASVAGLGLCAGAFATVFADAMEGLRVLTTLLGFATPIFYPLSVVPGSVREVVAANPLYRFVTLFRHLAYVGTLPPWTTIGFCVATPVVMLAAGAASFGIIRRAFPTVL